MEILLSTEHGDGDGARSKTACLFQNPPGSHWITDKHSLAEHAPPRKAQTASLGSVPGNTLLLKTGLSLAFSCLALSGQETENFGPACNDSSWAFMLVLSGARRLHKISLPATPCGKKECPMSKPQSSLASREKQLDRHILYRTSKRAAEKDLMFRSKTCFSRFGFEPSQD